MLVRFENVVAVIALAICLMTAFAGEFWEASHSPQLPSQSANAENEHRTDTETIEERHQATEEAMARYNMWLMAFTGILALATAGLGTMNYFQLRLANVEFISTHRPRLKVRRIFSVEAQDFLNMNIPLIPGQELNASLEIVNVGGSKATVISNQSSYRIYFGKENYYRVDIHAAGRQLASFQIALERGERVSFELVGRVPDDVAMEGTLIRPSFEPNAEWKMYIIGEVHYIDGMGTVRHLGFCRQLIRDRFCAIEDPDCEYED